MWDSCITVGLDGLLCAFRWSVCPDDNVLTATWFSQLDPGCTLRSSANASRFPRINDNQFRQDAAPVPLHLFSLRNPSTFVPLHLSTRHRWGDNCRGTIVKEIIGDLNPLPTGAGLGWVFDPLLGKVFIQHVFGALQQTRLETWSGTARRRRDNGQAREH